MKERSRKAKIMILCPQAFIKFIMLYYIKLHFFSLDMFCEKGKKKKKKKKVSQE